MKQLLHFDPSNSTLAFALGHRGFLYENEKVTELDLSVNDQEEKHQQTKEEEEPSKESSIEDDKSPKIEDEIKNDERSIQAIAYDAASHTTAVALRNKKLYLIRRGQESSLNERRTSRVVIITEKRITKLLFTKLDETTTLLLASDMVGDLTAYRVDESDTTDASKLPKTLLLGHTASVLTDMCLVSSYILTADRDEKIRVSHFPKAHEIHGYLLSHTAFVSSMCSIRQKLASVAGDGRIIVWNVATLEQEASCCISNTKVVPTKILCIDQKVFWILCDKDCQLYTVSYDESTASLQPMPSHFTFPSIPIDMCHCGTNIVVLFREPPFLRFYSVSSNIMETTSSQLTKHLSELPVAATIPISRLEHSCIAKHGIEHQVKRANHMERLPKQKDRIREKRQRRK